MRFGRILLRGKAVYCLIEGDRVRPLAGDVFGSWQALEDCRAEDHVSSVLCYRAKS